VKGKGKERGRWKLKKSWSHGRTDGRTRHVILYSVQCYALHWTDNNRRIVCS